MTAGESAAGRTLDAATPSDIAAVVDAARARAFVGRAVETAGFRALLGDDAHRVLFVHGAGGLGKTALLHQFRSLARAHGRVVIRIDGEDVGGSIDALVAPRRAK